MNGFPSTIKWNPPSFFTSCGIGLLCAHARGSETASAMPIRISFRIMKNLPISFRRDSVVNAPPAW